MILRSVRRVQHYDLLTRFISGDRYVALFQQLLVFAPAHAEVVCNREPHSLGDDDGVVPISTKVVRYFLKVGLGDHRLVLDWLNLTFSLLFFQLAVQSLVRASKLGVAEDIQASIDGLKMTVDGRPATEQTALAVDLAIPLSNIYI